LGITSYHFFCPRYRLLKNNVVPCLEEIFEKLLGFISFKLLVTFSLRFRICLLNLEKMRRVLRKLLRRWGEGIIKLLCQMLCASLVYDQHPFFLIDFFSMYLFFNCIFVFNFGCYIWWIFFV
jgi:hypothetical protein